jgi:phage terminase large subunit-like protein
MAKSGAWPPSLLTPVPAADVKRGDGELVSDFIEGLCPQVKDSIGGRAGEPFNLRPWQRSLLGSVFSRRSDGRLRHRLALVGMARKNGKSALGSGIALYGLIMGPKGGEVYSCAADRDQARIVFGSARAMVEASPELAAITKLYRDAIEVPGTGSVYRVLSSEAFTKEGLSPSLVLYDELHAAPNDELYNVMQLGQAARRDALMLAMTTAGVRSDNTGQDSVCYRLFQYGERIAKGEIEDPAFFMAWWKSADEADHRESKNWLPANPGFGDLQDEEDFHSAVKRTPENEFRTKRMNQWVNAQTAWLPSGSWESLEPCEVPVDDQVPVVLGFDGSFSNDATALVGVTVEESPRVFMVRAWEKQPTDTDDWRVPMSEVAHEVFSTCGRLDVLEIVCDPYRWQREMQEWAAAGLPVVEYPSSSPARMVPATAKFYDAVVNGNVSHDHDPLLARHIANCAVKVDRLGPRIVKEHRGSPRKIDAAVCAVMAFDRATQVREAEPVQPEPFFIA